ncbi:Spo0E family sporulation regulatory protein-aspartic acid phosphatase [Virgibacillus kimchii]
MLHPPRNTKQNLTKLIEDKRIEMLSTAKTYGISNKRTLKCSQKLDELILEYQKEENKNL